MGSLLALLACLAGAGSAGRLGTSARAIDFPRLLGVNWGEAPRGDHPWKKFYINIFPSQGTYGVRGNLRNGSNAGSSYLNCWNWLGRTNWNYGAGDQTGGECSPFKRNNNGAIGDI